MEKFGGRCAFSGCNEPFYEFHHPDRYALNKYSVGVHERVIPLCCTHHQMAHAGLILNEEDPVEKWRLKFEETKEQEKMRVQTSGFWEYAKEKVDLQVREHWG